MTVHTFLYLYLQFIYFCSSVYTSYLSINLFILLYQPIFLSIYLLSLYLYKQRYISLVAFYRDLANKKRKFINKITRIIVDVCIVKNICIQKTIIQKNFGYFFILLYHCTLVKIPVFCPTTLFQLFLGRF